MHVALCGSESEDEREIELGPESDHEELGPAETDQTVFALSIPDLFP